jgi:MoaA/NifB/PqqE/SkfB family radical SAM enzyme
MFNDYMEMDQKGLKSYNQLRALPRVSLIDSVPLPFPLSIYIEPTNLCNFKCSFCPESFDNYHDISGGQFQLSLEHMDRIRSQILDITSGNGISTINFYMMGEPLINKFTPEFIKIAKQSKLAKRIILTSNGSLLKGERANALAINPPDYLRISIYGPDSDHHQKITQSKVKLEDIRDNILNFRNLKKPYESIIYVKMIDQGVDLNKDFIKMFEKVADEIEIEPVMNWNDPEEGNLAGITTEDLLKSNHFQNKKTVCPSPFYTLVIHSDLKVSVCCVDWAKKAVVGDLNVDTLADIWGGVEVENFRIKHLEGRRNEIPACAKCTYLHTYPDNLDGLTKEVYISRGKKD